MALSKENQQVTIKLPKAIIIEVDELTKKEGRASRSNTLAHLIQLGLEAKKPKQPQ